MALGLIVTTSLVASPAHAEPLGRQSAVAQLAAHSITVHRVGADGVKVVLKDANAFMAIRGAAWHHVGKRRALHAVGLDLGQRGRAVPASVVSPAGADYFTVMKVNVRRDRLVFWGASSTLGPVKVGEYSGGLVLGEPRPDPMRPQSGGEVTFPIVITMPIADESQRGGSLLQSVKVDFILDSPASGRLVMRNDSGKVLGEARFTRSSQPVNTPYAQQCYPYDVWYAYRSPTYPAVAVVQEVVYFPRPFEYLLAESSHLCVTRDGSRVEGDITTVALSRNDVIPIEYALYRQVHLDIALR